MLDGSGAPEPLRSPHQCAMDTDSRTQKQLRLIQQLGELLQTESIHYWLRGGWAHDFVLGCVTRAHEDIDLFVWADDSDRLCRLLARSGFAAPQARVPSHAQRDFSKEGERFHIAFLEKTADGRLVTPVGRWAAHVQSEAGVLNLEEWPAGMLDAPPGELAGLTIPIISLEALIHAIEFAARIPGHPLSEKHGTDLDRLRAAVNQRQGP